VINFYQAVIPSEIRLKKTSMKTFFTFMFQKFGLASEMGGEYYIGGLSFRPVSTELWQKLEATTAAYTESMRLLTRTEVFTSSNAARLTGLPSGFDDESCVGPPANYMAESLFSPTLSSVNSNRISNGAFECESITTASLVSRKTPSNQSKRSRLAASEPADNLVVTPKYLVIAADEGLFVYFALAKSSLEISDIEFETMNNTLTFKLAVYKNWVWDSDRCSWRPLNWVSIYL
jgi:hypothetical protein